jgi:prophage regulatory protein
MSHFKNLAPPMRVIRMSELRQRVGLAPSSIYAKVAAGDFPKPIRLSAKGASAWLEAEVEDWLVQRIALSRRPQIAA